MKKEIFSAEHGSIDPAATGKMAASVAVKKKRTSDSAIQKAGNPVALVKELWDNGYVCAGFGVLIDLLIKMLNSIKKEGK